jgi:hypothetical protein
VCRIFKNRRTYRQKGEQQNFQLERRIDVQKNVPDRHIDTDIERDKQAEIYIPYIQTENTKGRKN